MENLNFKELNAINFNNNSLEKINISNLNIYNGVIKDLIFNNSYINSDKLIIPNFTYFNFINNDIYINNNKLGVFNLSNIILNSLDNQLKSFKKDKLIPLIYIDNILNCEDIIDDIIIFSKKNFVKIMVNVGSTLNEMGEFDKLYKQSPIDYLEYLGVLDLQPIILSAVHLLREDLEKIAYYNASICLNISNDLLNANGIAPINLMQKLHINMCFATTLNDIFKEMFLCFSLPQGILNTKNIIDEQLIFKMATTNLYYAMNLDNEYLKINHNSNFTIIKNNNNWLNNLIVNGKFEIIHKFCNGKQIK